MSTVPNFVRIAEVLFAWHNGVVTDAEAHERIQWALSPENFVPRDELCGGWPQKSGPDISTMLLRFEDKLNALCGSFSTPFPSTSDPNILSEGVKMLAEQGDTIYAVKEHRNRTGAGLAATVALIKAYMRDKGAVR
jgi:hypothetical protein